MAGGAQKLLKAAFTENLRLKALAVVITILIFGLVRGGRETTARITVDVELLRPGDAAKRVLMTEVPETVKVRVRGSHRLVQMVSDEEIPPVTLDFREQDDGTFELGAAPFRIPPGLEVVSVTPSSVDLRFEDRVSRQVAVVPVLSGDAAAGSHVKDPTQVEPGEVTVSGPASEVEEITEVATTPVVIGGLGPGQHERRVRLVAPPDHTRYVGGDQVEVTIIIEPDVTERVLARVPVEVRGTDLEASSETVNVVLRGPPEALTAFDASTLTAYVQLGEEASAPGAHRAPVRIEGVAAPLEATPDPTTVIVEVTRAAAHSTPPPSPEEPPDAEGEP